MQRRRQIAGGNPGEAARGSGAFAILTTAVIIGNAPEISAGLRLARPARLEPQIQDFHAKVTFIIKSFFFTFIGTMIRPPWGLIFAGVLFGLVLLGLRWPAVRAALAGAGRSPDEKNLVTILLPRGMAAGVLALMPHQAGVAGTAELPVLVFSAVLTTILIFAVGFPFFKKRLLGARPAEAAPPAQAATPPGF